MPRLMAALYDAVMRDMERACVDAWRRELLVDVRGDVLEIGAGTGTNVHHYAGLERLTLAEPDVYMRRRLRSRVDRLASSPARSLAIVPWTAEALEAADASFDVVVATLVLCSVREPAAALDEIRRVLRPGGRLVFLEHVAADNPQLLAWQRRLEPAWVRLVGNCHLRRDTARIIEDAGFHLDRIVRESAQKTFPIVRTTIRGVARLREGAPR